MDSNEVLSAFQTFFYTLTKEQQSAVFLFFALQKANDANLKNYGGDNVG